MLVSLLFVCVWFGLFDWMLLWVSGIAYMLGLVNSVVADPSLRFYWCLYTLLVVWYWWSGVELVVVVYFGWVYWGFIIVCNYWWLGFAEGLVWTLFCDLGVSLFWICFDCCCIVCCVCEFVG